MLLNNLNKLGLTLRLLELRKGSEVAFNLNLRAFSLNQLGLLNSRLDFRGLSLRDFKEELEVDLEVEFLPYRLYLPT